MIICKYFKYGHIVDRSGVKYGTRGNFYIWNTFDIGTGSGVFRCTCLKIACNSKTTGRRPTGMEIKNLAGISNIYMRYL